MSTDYRNWSVVALDEEERRALGAIYRTWRQEKPTDHVRAVFLAVRAGMPAVRAERWIPEAAGDRGLLRHNSKLMLVPTLAAALALLPDDDVVRDLADLERFVEHRHRAYDPEHPEPSVPDLKWATELDGALGTGDPAQVERLYELARVHSTMDPLFWTSFEAFLDRSLPRPAPRTIDAPRLPIEARIEQVEWRGIGPYRSATRLRLSPWTALVGGNGAGKTSALVALALLRELARRGLPALDMFDERVTAGANEVAIAATAQLERPGARTTETVSWQLDVGRAGRRAALRETLRRTLPSAGHADDAELATFTRGTGRWRAAPGELVEHTMRPDDLALTTATSPAAHSQLMALRQGLADWCIELATAGSPPAGDDSATAALADSYRRRPDAFDDLRRAARAVTRVRELELTDDRGLVVAEAGGPALPVHLASAGVARAIGILAWLFAPVPPPLLAIDELENHLHVDLAARLLDVMRSTSHRTTVVLTTHSARVIQAFEPHEISVVRRDERGSSIVAVADDPRLRRLVEAGSAGDLIHAGYFSGAM